MRAIRIVTFNLWHDAAESDARMNVLMPQLRMLDPHVIGLQEVRHSAASGVNQAALVAEALGADYRFAAVDAHSNGGPIGNAVVSRLPIIRDETIQLPAAGRDPRNALRCDLETPAGRLAFVTAHLTWELDAAGVRESQAVLLDAWARRDPGPLPTVMTGDFNCAPDSRVHQFLTGRSSLEGASTYWRDAYQRRHPHSDGFTWSARNPHVARSVERNRRIDYVFVGPMHDHGPGAILHARVVLDLPNAAGMFPSDHFGVMVEVSTRPTENGL